MANPEPQQESCCIIELDEEWVNSLKHKARDAYQIPQAGECTIFRVPRDIRKQDPDAYEPQIISLGPYHQSKPCLQAMNEIKLHFLSLFLLRNPRVALEDYLRELKRLEEKARSCYSENIRMTSDDFVEMLLVDSCFVVEFLHQFEGNDDLHPFFKTLGAWNSIINDMLMLENQLPFFVLEKIFDLANLCSQCASTRRKPLKDHAFDLCKIVFPNGVRMPSEESVPRFHHLLHFLHSCIAPTQRQQQNDAKTLTPESIPWAIQLVEAGVKFRTTEEEDKSFLKSMKIKEAFKKVIKKASNPELSASSTEQATKSFLDITFVNGVLSIPTLKIYDNTNLLFRNLIAFEQCFPAVRNHVAAYSAFMDDIIDTPMDVALLRRNKVIENFLGSNEDAAVLFNNIVKEVVINTKKGYLSDVLRDVTRYCSSRRHRYRRKLMHDYFNSPWAFISLVAAVILLLLTAIQAVFSVLSYYQQPK